jgi:KUP system potassium uptake protein
MENGTARRTAINVHGLALLTLGFQTLGELRASLRTDQSVNPFPGIIYSDLGTSPLYVLNGIWPAHGPTPSKEDVVGAISAIIWSLTLAPFIKYVSRHVLLECFKSDSIFRS